MYYDPVKNEWIRYDPRGFGPSGRSLHTATVVGRKIYIFGGANSTGNRNDTSGFCDLYELDIDTLCWTECEIQNTPPSPCYGHTATYIGDNRILYYGGKGYQVLNTIHVLNLNTMEWKQNAYAGNTLVARWGHSATLHDNKILFFGGRSTPGYHNTIDIIDVEKELIEFQPEEQEKEKHKRKYEEKNKTYEALGNLQTTAAELAELTNHIGEQLLIQKKAINETKNAMLVLLQENQNLKQQLERLAPNYLEKYPINIQPVHVPQHVQRTPEPRNFTRNEVDIKPAGVKPAMPEVIREPPRHEIPQAVKEVKMESNVNMDKSSSGNTSLTGSGNNIGLQGSGSNTGFRLHLFPPPSPVLYSGPQVVDTASNNDEDVVSY